MRDTKDHYTGDEAQGERSILRLTLLIEHGILTGRDYREKL